MFFFFFLIRRDVSLLKYRYVYTRRTRKVIAAAAAAVPCRWHQFNPYINHYSEKKKRVRRFCVIFFLPNFTHAIRNRV